MQVNGGTRTRGVRRIRGGSVVLFVLIVSMAVGFAILALVALTGQASRRTTADEHGRVAQYAMEAAVTKIRLDAIRGRISPPQVINTTVGNLIVTSTVTDNWSNMARTLKVDEVTVAWGRTYKASRIIAVPPSPFDFAYSINSPVSFNATMNVYGGGGMYINGNLAVNQSGSDCSGDLVLAGVLNGSRTMNVWGDTFPSSPPIYFPPAIASDYAADADQFYGSSKNFNGINFPQPYYLIYVNGDVTISGTITGTGTIFATGDIKVSDSQYANSSSHIAVICNGTVMAGPGNTTSVGLYYGNIIDLTSPPRLKISKGCFVGQSSDVNRGIDITWDPVIRDDRTMGYKLRLPGFWP